MVPYKRKLSMKIKRLVSLVTPGVSEFSKYFMLVLCLKMRKLQQ